MWFIKADTEESDIPKQKFTQTEQGVVKLNGVEDIVLPRLPDPCSTVIDFRGDKLTVTPNQASQPNIGHPKLSLREAEVLQYLANGLSPEQTALAMKIKIRTVRKYLGNLRKKFNTESRDQLMASGGYLRLCDPYKIISQPPLKQIE
jgi:DNA-binding CsgD family transcriptional regulator